jgi:uncharacterized protein with FMN-binding domain
MKARGKRKMYGWLIALVVLAVLAAVGGKAWWYLAREHKEARSLPLDAVDFSKLQDGTYNGEYEGGMYKWRANTVRVTVAGGKVTQIEPLSGVEDQGNGSTQMLYERVIQAQSLQVDTISGATLTANAYLQAIENALLEAEQG